MKQALLFSLLLCPLGCGAFKDTLTEPEVRQHLSEVAQIAAEKAASKMAGEFQVTDQSAINNMVREAKTAASAAVQQATQRIEVQDREARRKWREETRAQISASLQGMGGALSATGNPILVGLGLLMGVGGVLTSRKKEEKTA